VNVDKVDDAVTSVVRELRRIAEERVPADELEKARNYARGRFVFQTETPQGLLQFALRRELIEGGSPEPEEALAGLGAVTADDVHRVAAELFAPGRLRLALIGPFDDPARFERLLS
jgi:predicted Zn-dependent peptidase